MKKNILVLLTAIFAFGWPVVVVAQYEDLYYNPDKDSSYYDDYNYSSRIRRFHRPYKGLNYFDPDTVVFTKSIINGQSIETGNVWIVAVSIHHYQNKGRLNDVDFDVYGAYAFSELYQTRQLTFSPPIILIDRNARRSEILKMLESTFVNNPELTSDDMILFYFSGHGGMAGSSIGICPYDYSGDTRDLISEQTIQDILRRSRARHKVCFIEACKTKVQSLEITDPRLLESFNRQRRNVGNGLVFITSTEAGKESLGPSNIGGYFSHFLVRGLKGEANTNNDAFITAGELFPFVQDNVKKATQNQQVPQINDNYDPSMPLMVLPSKLPKEPIPPKEESEAQNKIISQRVKDLEIRVTSVKKSSNSIDVTLKFIAFREGYGTGYALKAAGSDGLADYWKFSPSANGKLVDNLGNEYKISTITGLGYAREVSDWTVLKTGEEAIANIEFSSNSSRQNIGSTFDFYLEIWVAYSDGNRKSAKMAYTINFRGVKLNN
ncbi:MAG: caspase family protein [Saprospiraceae bacterium]|nr:MAG: caspase family protein [Saprospiraceae bacterium]